MIKINIKKKPVGAVAVVVNADGHILLLRRSPASYFAPDQWGYPGGKIEEGETPLEAALRETEEETQLRVYNAKSLGIFNDAVAAFYSDKFDGKVEIDFEHTDWKWVPPDEITGYDLAPSVLKIYEKVRDSGN